MIEAIFVVLVHVPPMYLPVYLPVYLSSAQEFLECVATVGENCLNWQRRVSHAVARRTRQSRGARTKKSPGIVRRRSFTRFVRVVRWKVQDVVDAEAAGSRREQRSAVRGAGRPRAEPSPNWDRPGSKTTAAGRTALDRTSFERGSRESQGRPSIPRSWSWSVVVAIGESRFCRKVT